VELVDCSLISWFFRTVLLGLWKFQSAGDEEGYSVFISVSSELRTRIMAVAVVGLVNYHVRVGHSDQRRKLNGSYIW
jgi:hypothetical protein